MKIGYIRGGTAEQNIARQEALIQKPGAQKALIGKWAAKMQIVQSFDDCCHLRARVLAHPIEAPKRRRRRAPFRGFAAL